MVWSRDHSEPRPQLLPTQTRPIATDTMDKYLLCGEITSSSCDRKLYKGREKGSVRFVSIYKYIRTKEEKEAAANAVSECKRVEGSS